MNKETFAIIEENLTARINECKLHLDSILTTEDLKNITIGEAQKLKDWCIREAAIMTEIVMVDFYHVIGMGELTVLQTNTFIKLIKEYVSYRSDLKVIGNKLDLEHLPELPSQSTFTLRQLGNIKLKSKIRGRAEAKTIFEEHAGVADYENAKQDLAQATNDILNHNGAFSIQDNIITFKSTELNTFIQAINPTLSRGKITSAAAYQGNQGRAYARIFWQYTDASHTKIKAIVDEANGYLAGIKKSLERIIINN